MRSSDRHEYDVSTLNKDLKNLLTEYLNGEDGFNLLCASPTLFLPVKNNISKRADHPLRKLLGHGALGELESGEKIWRKNPYLLTCRGTIYHPNRCYIDADGNPLSQPIAIPFNQNPGRYKYIDRTYWQILLMNDEWEEALEIVKAKLMTEEEIQKQFYEVFPDGEIKKYDFDLQKAKELLQAVFDVVANDECLKIERDENNDIKNIMMGDSTREALHQLYHYAKPKSEHETGLVFDPAFYHEALKLFDEKSDGQFKQKWDAYAFWSICVEEWLAGCLGTACYRPHSRGLGNPASRSVCVLDDGKSGFSFRRASNSIPGFHFFVDYYGGSARQVIALRRRPTSDFQNLYVKQKREQGQALALCSYLCARKRHRV